MPPTQQELAIERTRIAHERTLMAWIRTSMSMVTFGFTISELFGYLGEITGKSLIGGAGPRIFGLGLIILGTVALIGAAIQHTLSLRQLVEPGERPKLSLALLVAVLMIVGGVLAFFIVILPAFSI